MSGLVTSKDGKPRCWWPYGPKGGDPEYIRYHDEEWGRPVDDDIRLFEKICLESFQSGLSWITILRKRENFRAAFAGFDFHKIADFTPDDVEHLLKDEGIVRNRAKIEATINNARQVLDIIDEFGSFAAYVWRFEPQNAAPTKCREDIQSQVPESVALAKDLKKRGFKFVGPTTVYAFMQAMGMVNDHLEGCFCYAEVEALRKNFKRPV